MNGLTRARTSGLLMCLIACSAALCVLGAETPMYAARTNCCQDCEEYRRRLLCWL